jgi:hypothetical protein
MAAWRSGAPEPDYSGQYNKRGMCPSAPAHIFGLRRGMAVWIVVRERIAAFRELPARPKAAGLTMDQLR